MTSKQKLAGMNFTGSKGTIKAANKLNKDSSLNGFFMDISKRPIANAGQTRFKFAEN